MRKEAGDPCEPTGGDRFDTDVEPDVKSGRLRPLFDHSGFQSDNHFAYPSLQPTSLGINRILCGPIKSKSRATNWESQMRWPSAGVFSNKTALYHRELEFPGEKKKFSIAVSNSCVTIEFECSPASSCGGRPTVPLSDITSLRESVGEFR